MKNEKRNEYMDFLKGFAILTVVVGHSISDIPGANLLFQLIYSFHMPLLFFISAWIEEQNREKYLSCGGKMLCRRASELLLPYVSWMILYELFAGNLYQSIAQKGIFLKLLGYEQSGLWFFPVLYGMKILHFLYWRLRQRVGGQTLPGDILICALLGILLVCAAVITRHPYVINMLSYAIVYLSAVIIVDHEILQRLLCTEWAAAGALLLYLLLFSRFSFYDTGWMTQVIRMGTSLCVIAWCCKFQSVWKKNRGSRILCIMGCHSLAIYVLHGFFQDYKYYLGQLESGSLLAAAAFLAAFAVAGVCMLIEEMMKNSSWLHKVLFGK